MKFNPTEVLLTLNGDEIQDGENGGLTIGKAVAAMLTSSQGQSADPLRSYSLGMKLYNAESEIDINESDLKFMKDEVTKNQSYIPLVRGQILQMLEKVPSEN